jgi:interferon gamma-inducible protein 30
MTTCGTGPLGDTLQRRALERTESLVPPHKWVPWVVVNGIPLFDDFDNVATFICAAFNGYPK